MDLKYKLIIPALVLKLLVLGIYTFRCIRYMRRKRKRERVLTPAPDYIVPPIPMPWHKHWHDTEAARGALPRARSDGISSVAQASACYPAVPYPTNSPYPTGTPYPHPSLQPAMLHPEDAGYPQGFATAAGYPPPGVAATPYPTYPSAPYPTHPSAPYPTYPSAPDANVMPPSYEQAVCAKPPPHNPYASH